MKKSYYSLIGLLVLAAVLAILLLTHRTAPKPAGPGSRDSANESPSPEPEKAVVDPLSRALERITKKHYGTFVMPGNSPVSPERFHGYHTATDFEILPGEENIDVPFYAICEGKILMKQTGRGYGGMFVQACTIDNQPVTVVYGHVSLKSIGKNVGDNLTRGEQIGNLGQPPGETDGERKHLHLGIHKGAAVNTSGYISNESGLSAWLDFEKL